MSTKLAELKAITDKINRKAKKADPERETPIVFIAKGNEHLLDLGTIATGNHSIDNAIGGGLQRGGFSMIAGQEGTGKTCMCLDMIAHNHTKDPEFIAIFVNLESNVFPYHSALAAGNTKAGESIDFSRLIVINAENCAEKTFDIMMDYLFDWTRRKARNLVDLVVIDSVAAAVPSAEVDSTEEKGMASITVGRQAAMFSKYFRLLAGMGALGKTCMLFINQIRTDINSYGGGKVHPGGNPIKFFPKISISVSAPKGEYLKRGPASKQEVYGHLVKGKVDKNNTGLAFPHQEFSYSVLYGQGVDLVEPLIELAIAKGVIEQTSSAWFLVPNEETGEMEKVNGKGKVEEMLRESQAKIEFIQSRIAAADTIKAEVEAPTQATPIDEDELEEVVEETIDE